MKEIAISEFKAKCLGILEEVRKTRKPIRVTRFGKPVAEVVPPSPRKPVGKRLGCMVGTGGIVGVIVGSISPLMKLLLDTHIWLWSVLEPTRVSKHIARAIDNRENQRWLSPISVWKRLMLTQREECN
jgi:prevent-host-death family protein